jgi:Leucine-rich repeat (LRR) protein
LRVLDIQENSFYTIPNIIFNLTKLKKLNIYSNAIKKIPDGIGALTQLTDLCLSYCNIEILPDSMGQLKQLKTLDLSYNYIYSLPKSMTELKNLESVNLASNGLRIEDICPFLLELPQLKYVYLNALLLSQLSDAFYTLKNLHYLNLSENQLSLETLFRAAESVQNPTSIHIHSPNIDPSELFDEPPQDPVPYITEIPDAIGRFTQLKAFSIAQANDIIKISPKIAQLTQLETVSFYGLKVLETFPDVFDQLPNLHTLTIENCEKLKYYPPSIYKLQCIKSLCLSKNNCLPNWLLLKQMTTLSSLRIPMVAPTELEHLAALTALESLKLESNADTTFLPPALRQLTHLKQVQFGDCPKLDLAQALQQLPYLERFEIHEAFQTENLVFPPTIRELHLNYGLVSPTTLLHWVETLPHLETVIMERFSDNYIPKKITLLNHLKHFLVKKHLFYGTEPLEWVLLNRPKIMIGQTDRWTERDTSPIETAAHRVQDLQLPTNQHKMFAFGLFSGMTRLLKDGLDNPFAPLEMLKNCIFYIMGKPSWQTSSLLKADLKTFGAKTTPNWMDATHILLCPQSHDDMLC